MTLDAWNLEIAGRILLAAVLGLLVGLERERHGRAAGLRTCILVAASAALLMALSLHLGRLFADLGADSVFRLDPARLPSYAIAGMGFLGAGAIIQGRSTAVGVTTAAALWTLTGVGLAVGAGLYLPALVATALALVVLNLLHRLARHIPQAQHVTLVLEDCPPAALQKVRNLLDDYDAQVKFVGRRRQAGRRRLEYTIKMVILSGRRWGEMLDQLEHIEDLGGYQWHESRVP